MVVRPSGVRRGMARNTLPRRGPSRRRRAAGAWSAEHPVEVGVGEAAFGVERVAQGDELVEARVPVAELLGAEGVQLAPVRPAADVLVELLDLAEVRVVRRAL